MRSQCLNHCTTHPHDSKVFRIQVAISKKENSISKIRSSEKVGQKLWAAWMSWILGVHILLKLFGNLFLTSRNDYSFFYWIKLKFAAYLTTFETGYELKFHFIWIKTNWEIIKTMKFIKSWKSCYFYYSREWFFEIKSHHT